MRNSSSLRQIRRLERETCDTGRKADQKPIRIKQELWYQVAATEAAAASGVFKPLTVRKPGDWSQRDYGAVDAVPFTV